MLSNCGRATILILLALGLGACGGGGTGPAELVAPDAPSADPLALAPALPQDAWVDPAEIIARRGSEIVDLSLNASEVFAASANTAVDGTMLRLAPTGAPAGAWVVYAFSDLTDADYPLELTFNTEPRPAEPYYVGYSDYTHGAWKWRTVHVPTASDAIAVDRSLNTISPGGTLYVVVMTYGDSPVRLASVSLRMDSYYLPAPQGLSATQGTHPAGILLSWDDPALTYLSLDYDSIEIEAAADLAGPWEPLGSVAAGVTSYEHGTPAWTPISVEKVHFRLRTALADHHGSPGLAVTGWPAIPDVPFINASDDLHGKVTIQWEPVEGVDGYVIEYWVPDYRYEPDEWTLLAKVDAVDGSQFDHSPEGPSGQELVLYRTYEYRVKACVGDSYSLNWSFVDSGRAYTIRELLASDGLYPDKVNIRWSRRYYDDAYTLFYRNAGGGSPAEWTHLADFSADISYPRFEHLPESPPGQGAEYNTVYEYKLHGVVGDEMNPEPLVTDTGFRSIGVVENLTASTNDLEKISLAWDAVYLADGYVVEYRSASTGTPVDWTTLVELDVSSLGFDHTESIPPGLGREPRQLYGFRVKALWQGEQSPDWSPIATGVSRFGAVTGFDVTDGYYNDRTVLTWDAVYNAEDYRIEYRSRAGGTPMDWEYLADVVAASNTRFEHSADFPVGKGCILHDAYEYRIKARTGSQFSPAWSTETGYAGAAPGDWHAEGRDRKHQRRSPFSGPDDPVVLWSIELDAYIEGSPVFGRDGTAFVCDEEGNLYSISADGHLRWQYYGLDYTKETTPLVGSDGTIYYSGEEYPGEHGHGFYLHAVNPDGTKKWSQMAAYSDEQPDMIASPVETITGNIVWSYSHFQEPWAGRLYLTSPEGDPLWAYLNGCTCLHSAAIDDSGTIWVCISDLPETANERRLYRLHAISEDGTTQSVSEILGAPFGPVVGVDGRIYTLGFNAESDNMFHCFRTNGTIQWSRRIPSSYSSIVAAGADGSFYTEFLSRYPDQPGVIAVNPQASTRCIYELTEYEYYNSSQTSKPMIDGAGIVYCTYRSNLYAINPEGSLKWQLELDGYDTGDPAMREDGVIVIGANKVLYAIGQGGS